MIGFWRACTSILLLISRVFFLFLRVFSIWDCFLHAYIELSRSNLSEKMNLGVKSMLSTNSIASCSWKSGDVVGVQFPVGLKVLVVDDDPTCLRILEKMLKNCLYEVTTCNRAEGALDFLRDKKDGCDIVISDVHMPDMDGFKLLELVGLEMDLPVIMMSADDSKHVVMKGVTHGACDYLIKPVRIEALKNIWQHVVRKKKHEWKENDLENSGQKPLEDVDCSSSFNEGNWKNSKKRKDEEEDETEDRDDTSTLKKPRVVWSVELHQQFVSAVNHLGIDKAVPKRILELMNVPGLTRENVASHLQKFRLYLRRLSGVSQHPFMGPLDPLFGPMSYLDLQAHAASGQLPPQSFASIQAAALGRAPVKQRNVFNFESPKPRFVEGQQQQVVDNKSKQVKLVDGISRNMHQSAVGNMNMHLHSQTNPLLMQISNSPSSVGHIPSAIRGPQYVSISQPARGIPPNYNVNQDWRLQDVGSSFMPPQHLNNASIEQQKSGVSAGLGNVGQQRLSFSASDSRALSNNYGQEDLMSVLLKQVEHDKLNHYS